MNPPTIGHKKLVDVVASQPGDPFLFITHTQKPKTDPLDFQTKLKFATKFFPNVTVGDSEVNTIIKALQKIESMGYTSITYVAGSDRVEQFKELITKYNGKEYKFNNINVVSAGERDPDADGAEGMSASKMRAAAISDDFDSFKQGVVDQSVANQLYDAVRKGMGLLEDQVTELKVMQQRPKIDVLTNIAVRKDSTPFPLSYKDTGDNTASTGGKIYIGPKDAAKFIKFYDTRAEDEQALMQKALKSINNAEKLFTNLQIQVKVEPSNYNESQLNEVAFLAPLGAAAVWLLRWVLVKGSWEILKWMLKRHGGKIAGIAAITYYGEKGWAWVREQLGEKAYQLLVENGFNLAMAVTFILSAVVIKKFVEEKGEKLASYFEKDKEKTNESDVVVDKDLNENPIAPIARFGLQKAAGAIARSAPSIGATAGAAAHRVKKVTNQVFKSNGKSNHTVGSARVPGASGYTKPGDETNALDVLASSQKNRNKKIKKESSDLVMDKESLIDYLHRAITKFAEQETDVEKLSYILKKLSGKKIATRNDRYYTITDEDVQEGLGRVLKGLKGPGYYSLDKDNPDHPADVSDKLRKRLKKKK